jgi:hypothetical protein
VISLNLILAGLRLDLKNRQVGEKWVKQVIAHIEKEPNYKDILAALKGIK